MIKDFESFHGIVFATLIHYSTKSLSVKQYPSSDNSSYVINGSIGIYIKYSTKRMSPWQFTFEERHNAEILEMSRQFRKVVVMLVCRDDGVVGLTCDEFGQIVEATGESTVSVSVVRKPREKYAVKGPLGRFPNKIGMTDYCQKVLG